MAIELMPQIPSRNRPNETQTTPIYQPIPLSKENNKMTNHGNDDETPFTGIPNQDNKVTSTAHQEEENKLPPLASNQKSSLWNSFKSKYKARCFIEESKLKKILASFILILMLANLAILIPFEVYFSRKKDIGFEAANGALSYIALNLASHPILDIQTHSDGSSCPEGYHSLLLGAWPGTTDGCECSTYLRKGQCRKKGKGSNEGSCTDISSINPINMYDWGGEEWCVLRAIPGSQYRKAVKCPEGFRKCSSGICVLETLGCPITKVELTGGAILTENIVGEPPVIGFAITPNDIPCIGDNYFPSGLVAPYVLIDKENGCSKYGLDDQYSFALDKVKQKELFDENDFPKKVYDLPDYAKVYKKTDSVLSYRRRLSVAEKDFCLNVNTEILENLSDVTKDLNRFLDGTLISALIIHGILIFMVVEVMMIQKCNKSPISGILEGKGEGKSKFWIVFYFIIGVADYIDLIVMFAVVVHFRAQMIVVSDYLRDLTDEGCFLDLQAQSAASDYQIAVHDVIGNYFRFSLSLFLIWSVAIFSYDYLFWKVMRN